MKSVPHSLYAVVLSSLFCSVSAFAYPQQISSFARRSWTVGESVSTSSGQVVGKAADEAPQVSEYLGIPFAQPPVGDLRWAAPQAFVGNGTINATAFGPSCPINQAGLSNSALSSLAGPNALNLFAGLGEVGVNFGEDCLSLNVWTKPQSGNNTKAVLFWIYGGGFSTGTSNDPTYNGQYLADREDVVVVTANYRLNVLGFPGLPGLADVAQNAGLMDQRMAIEWTRHNIANFGGDPDRITIFGQSAGAASVDFYNFAYVDDPIIAGSIAESGTATGFYNPIPTNNTAVFFNVSSQLGCPTSSAQAAVDCLRGKPYTDLLQAIVVSNPFDAVLGLFGPTADEKTVFENYTVRAQEGNFIKKPYFTGNNDYEAGLFKILAAAGNETLPDAYWDAFNLDTFTCPAADAASVRAAAGVPTWRYRYYGEFPNLRLTLNPPSGAWHGAEIAIVFQTAEDASGENNTVAEDSISSYLSGAWAAFAKDPAGAFDNAPYAFPRYDPNTASLIQFARNNMTLPTFAFPNSTDALCPAGVSGA